MPDLAGVDGKVGLVFVSHSEKIADGLVGLALQMAPNTSIFAAGGTDDGKLGTSFDLVTRGIASVDSGRGVVVLCDLGSAILTAETAIDFLDDEVRARVAIVDAPLVEGAVAAAVAAEGGGDLSAVVSAARSAISAFSTDNSSLSLSLVSDAVPTSAAYTRTVTVVNKDGLHARPAAEFVKLAHLQVTPVTVNGKDARSLLGIMSLGLVRGDQLELASSDPDGRVAVDALATLVESGFGEV